MKAFGVVLFVMALILMTQFNSFYQAFLILRAVVLSTVGVLLGLLITRQPFGIVMSGVGLIALAGIVVNNIVVIDTYNILRRTGMDALGAILRTGALSVSAGPSTQWWTQLATAVAGGLAFATLLTLVLTPALLILGERLKKQRPAFDVSPTSDSETAVSPA